MSHFNKLFIKLIAFIATLKNIKGQGLVEYALILVLLVAIVIAAMGILNGSTHPAFNKVVNSLNQ